MVIFFAIPRSVIIIHIQFNVSVESRAYELGVRKIKDYLDLTRVTQTIRQDTTVIA